MNSRNGINGTYRQLLEWANEPAEFKKHFPLHSLLLRSRIEQWQKNNSIRLKLLKEGNNKLIEEFFVMVGGQIQFDNDKDGKPEHVKFKEGKTKEEFDKVKDAFLDTEIVIYGY